MCDKNTVFQEKKTINAGGRLLDFSEPKVMGILNITPDSFYQDSRTQTVAAALVKAEKMLSDGAAILDIGAYSSRPGASDIPPGEEQARLLPVIRAIRGQFPGAVLSIDTFRASVAEASIAEGADIINDISGGELDPLMFETIGRLQVPYILMHMRGTPLTMASLTQYDDMFKEIMQYFSSKLAVLNSLNVHDIILDPGFGFAKTADQNLRLLNNLELFKTTGLPVLAGLSRKKTIWQTLGVSSNEALNGTTVLNTVALMKGADLLRVHDVKEATEAIKLVSSLRRSSEDISL
ncbi:dihydropteroate synthase [Arcticibacter tournemirensis]|uniref:dihydropteroate synthase n=1 Tax=Arcticibacter tournemirensis TaxID=699437 RepID=A0A5M9HJ56_9SPHI|nr:dihydropteroate synthase [Arcticibacter tournemirensis]KAA8486730.1 dihydropteroate synthase [Arcticibacter tournemirensis]TQM49270.1 dihydropteroate synthase [Arcticibacter tournemirensis]